MVDVDGARKNFQKNKKPVWASPGVCGDRLFLLALSVNEEAIGILLNADRFRETFEFRERRRVLFPISICSFTELRDWECFDADAGKDSAREIREYFIPDFSNW